MNRKRVLRPIVDSRPRQRPCWRQRKTKNELKSLVKDLRHVLNCHASFLEEHSVDSVLFFPLAKCVPSQCLSAKCLQEESCSKMRCDYWIGFCRRKPPRKWLVAFTRALGFRELASSMVQGAQPSPATTIGLMFADGEHQAYRC